MCSRETLGFDGVDHMGKLIFSSNESASTYNYLVAEEIKDAQRVIPFSMVFSAVFNGLLGFSMLTAILFCMGDIDDPALTETTFPFIVIFQNALGSEQGGLALVSPLSHYPSSFANRGSVFRDHSCKRFIRKQYHRNSLPNAVGLLPRERTTLLEVHRQGE